jgi:hypothetical protein
MATRKELSDAYQAVSSRLLNAAGTSASNLFKTLPDWRDENIATFIQKMDALMTSSKSQAAKLAVAYYREISKLENQRFVAPVISPEELSTSVLRNGADPEQVYTRPFVDMRTALSKGASVTDAINKGAFRAQDLARTEIQLARRGAGLRARGRNQNIVGYLRVLSGAENCALCYVASTQRYRKGDLLPIHPGCDCGETPIYGTTDVGQVIDQERLDATHESIAERFGVSDRSARAIDYSKIAVREHGELGPVLTVADQNFTGPNDLPPARTWGD